jgi:hypothetical protein
MRRPWLPPLTDFGKLVPRLLELRHVVNEEIIFQLEPAVNSHLQAESKVQGHVTNQVSETLASLNLAFRHPISGTHSNLYTLPPSSKNPHGRIGLRPKGATASPVSGVRYSDILPLRLMEAEPRREPLAEWHYRIKKPPKDRER